MPTEYKLLISVDPNPNLEKFLALYREDPVTAGIIFRNGRSFIYSYRFVQFIHSDNSLAICLKEKKWGISVSNRIYSFEHNSAAVFIKNNKFYFKVNKILRPLSIQYLENTFSKPQQEIIQNIIIEKYPQLRFMWEFPKFKSIAFNTIFAKKLFSFEKVIKYFYHTTYPNARKLYNGEINLHLIHKNYKYLTGLENIADDMIGSQIFDDSLRMAAIVGKQLNLAWSQRRLIEEHDKWAKIIGVAITKGNNKVLKVNEKFVEFANYSGYELLSSSVDLAVEGLAKSHCVASYESSVDSGYCGIYKVQNYTLDLRLKENDDLYINQFRGFGNSEPPKELKLEVIQKLEGFMNKLPVIPHYWQDLPSSPAVAFQF